MVLIKQFISIKSYIPYHYKNTFNSVLPAQLYPQKGEEGMPDIQPLMQNLQVFWMLADFGQTEIFQRNCFSCTKSNTKTLFPSGSFLQTRQLCNRHFILSFLQKRRDNFAIDILFFLSYRRDKITLLQTFYSVFPF